MRLQFLLRNVLLTYLAFVFHHAARAVMLVRPFLTTQKGSSNHSFWPYGDSVAPSLTGGRPARQRGETASSSFTSFLQKPDHNFWPYVPVKSPAWPNASRSYYDVPRHNFWPFIPVAPPSPPRGDSRKTTVKPGLKPLPVTPPPGPLPTLPRPENGYDYGEVIYKSILFYEAQRSGWLPDERKVQWRGHSALEDRGEQGEDLTGGWYDAGDYVKFGFPMAGATTMLLMGLIEFRDAYESLGLLGDMYDCVRWPLDYFMKAHPSQYEFYAQVADPYVDHSYWGRPEDMTMYRPAYKLSPENPGSDVIGETAAALAAGAVAFTRVDKDYSNLLLRHAVELFDFAYRFRGLYSDSLPIVQEFYSSSGYTDELAWAAAWLYRATGDKRYLQKAEDSYVSTECWAVSWDSKDCLAALLLYKLTGKNDYRNDIERTMRAWMPGGSVDYTPAGLAFRTPWGPIRYTANMATLALVAANAGIEPLAYRTWARDQIHYMLGDSGRSFVIGFGYDPPVRPHHAASSCPPYPDECTWVHFTTSLPNPITLYGAVVGGPAIDDDFRDARDDYYQNEVTCDYNAGFQSAVAGLIQMELQKEQQELIAGMKQLPGYLNKNYFSGIRHTRPPIPNFRNVFPARNRTRNSNTNVKTGQLSTRKNNTMRNITNARKNVKGNNPNRSLNNSHRNKFPGNGRVIHYRNVSKALEAKVQNIRNMDRGSQKKNWGGLLQGFASQRTRKHRTRRQQLRFRGGQGTSQNRGPQRNLQTHHPFQNARRRQTDQRQQILQNAQRQPALAKTRLQRSFPKGHDRTSNVFKNITTAGPYLQTELTRNDSGKSSVNRHRRGSAAWSPRRRISNRREAERVPQQNVYAQNKRMMERFFSSRHKKSRRPQRSDVKKVPAITVQRKPFVQNQRTKKSTVSSNKNSARRKFKRREFIRLSPNKSGSPRQKIQNTWTSPASRQRKGRGNISRSPFSRAEKLNKRSLLKYKRRLPKRPQNTLQGLPLNRYRHKNLKRHYRQSSRVPANQRGAYHKQQSLIFTEHDPKRNKSTAYNGRNIPRTTEYGR